jgi:hypothetical protein
MNEFKAFLLVELSTLAVANGKVTSLQSLLDDLESIRHGSDGMIPTQRTIDTWTMPDLRAHADKVKMLKAERLAGVFKASQRFREFSTTRTGLLVTHLVKANIGDQIWVIRDARVPIILRPILGSTQFTLVGEAYVDGVMDGEALKNPRCPRPVTIEIV